MKERIITPEDRLALRQIARGAFGPGFAQTTEAMARSLSRRMSDPAEKEAWVIAFFDVLQEGFMDVRNKLLAEIRGGAECSVEKPGAGPTSSSSEPRMGA